MPGKKSIQTNPWFPIPAKKTRSILGSKNNSVVKVVSGKRQQVKPTKIDQKERNKWIFYFIRQLEHALRNRAREEEEFWAAGIMSAPLANCIERLHRQVITAIDKTNNHARSGAAATLQNANSLLPLLRRFKFRCNAAIKSTDQLEMAMTLQELCDDVEHYVIQTRLTYGIVSVSSGKPRLGNRPTNSKAKAFYGGLIKSHQCQYGSTSFPKPAAVRKAMNDCGHAASVRTINLWKNQILNGTFDWYVQPKNRQ